LTKAIIALSPIVVIFVVFGSLKTHFDKRLTTTNDVFYLYPEGKTKALVLSYDDGAIEDLKLVSILNKYKLRGTFNITVNHLNKTFEYIGNEGVVHQRRFVDNHNLMDIYKNHEVGSHSVTHKHLNELSAGDQLLELRSSMDTLSKYLHQPIMSIAYPYGSYNAQTVLTASQLGYTNARTISNTQNFTPPEDWLQWHPTCHDSEAEKHLDSFFSEPTPFIKKARKLIYAKLKIKHQDLKLFTIWGHSHEYTDNPEKNWIAFETLCKKLAGNPQTWYATASQVANYHINLGNLVITKYELFNPKNNSQTLFFELNNKQYSLQPGEAFNIKTIDGNQ
jgi:peptidoglycan/xylan/chitin deacetylase (PgdA/CDA1 family)